jgi:murein DD-endopeptidase MepM/ murein hydrolase activator NlpD
VGFLNLPRRVLAAGAIAATGALMCIPAFSASADPLVVEVKKPNLQSFDAPANLLGQVVTRDGFGVTEYSLVQWPLPSGTTMSSGFGYRSCAGCSSNHLGIDLNPGNGYPIQAIADGTVVLAQESDAGLGVEVVVEHVIDGQTVQSLYGHMQFGSLGVSVGQTVSRGQQIGLVGNTGASTGPHLHFGILIGGTEVDPYAWLREHVNS